MISAEAPVLLAKAAEIFIEELTLRAWMHTEESKRKTLQKSDISQAVSRWNFDWRCGAEDSLTNPVVYIFTRIKKDAPFMGRGESCPREGK